MANTRSHKKSVSFAADVAPEEAPMEPGKSQTTVVPILKNSDGGKDVVGQASGSQKNDDKPNKTKRIKVLLAGPKKGDEKAEKPKTWLLSESEAQECDEAGTPEEQETFLREVKSLLKENSMEFKTPRFYGQPLNVLKLWRTVVKLGGYEMVTNCKLWRKVGEAFNPPKTCTTVSFTFRIFYEKALLVYEQHLRKNGVLDLPEAAPVMLCPKVEKKEASSHQVMLPPRDKKVASGHKVMLPPRDKKKASGNPVILTPRDKKGSGNPVMLSPRDKEASSHQGSRSGRVPRDSAVRARLGWHALDLFEHDEEEEITLTPRLKKLKTMGVQENQPPINLDFPVPPEEMRQVNAEIVDVGPVADWVKISVYETKNSYEVFILVPGLLREEVRVQSDPSGRVHITGKPEDLNNPWGITPFEKNVFLSARIDATRTSAVLTLYGRLFIRVPFMQ